ncbi:carboxypeptidase B-like isoform X2 [Formica exsecta]|uniref:carboxypeptidase B-like isoform X2 n=1 Tax=Formica exsecta TaxID=72781 RepID=UPI001143F6F5|nr:carboxypeptidase B-like isoform X2 [Formica exsecta]
MYVLLSKTVFLKMNNNELLRIKRAKWMTLMMMAIIVFVADASILRRQTRRVLGRDISEGKKQPKDLVGERITYEGDQVWRIHKDNSSVEELVQRYDEYGSYSIWSNNVSIADIFLESNMVENIESLFRSYGVKYEILIDDVEQAIKEENPPLSPEAQEELEGRKGHRMEWTTYHRLADINGYLDYLAETYPDFCSVQTIGNSIEGRPLKVLRISNGKSNAPAIWIDGGIHAREWISPASVTYIIDYLVENSENLEIDYYIMPVINPDGYEYTFTVDRLWRKNRRKSGYAGCSGVDLNRNFGYRWGGKGASKDICRDTYSGAKPFSEPETDAIRNFFEISSANFKAYLSFHSYGQYILYPWGYDKRLPPDYVDLDNVGRQAATAMKKAGGAASVYTVGNSATTLYPASGGSDDWAKALLKLKYTYTIELRDTGRFGFILPARYIIPTAKEALAAVEVVTEACKTA